MGEDTQPGYRIGMCLVCGVQGRWYIVREGDVMVCWSCDGHLALVIEDLRQKRPSTQRFIVSRSAHAAAGPEE